MDATMDFSEIQSGGAFSMVTIGLIWFHSLIVIKITGHTHLSLMTKNAIWQLLAITILF